MPAATSAPPSPEVLVGRQFLADLLGFDVRTVKNLVDEGMPKAGRGRFALSRCVQWYLERERERSRAGKGLNDLDLARQRKTSAEARLAELELARVEGSQVPDEVLVERISAVAESIRAVLNAVPSKYLGPIQATRTAMEAQAVGERIRDETLAALEQLADLLEAELPAAMGAPDPGAEGAA